MPQLKTGQAKVISEAAPVTAPTAAQGGAGNVNIGTHSWKVTFVHSGGGETLPGPKSNVLDVVTSASQVNLTAVPLGPAGTTARKIYRTVTGDTGTWKLVGTIADNTTTVFTDNIADGSLGADAPTVGTYPTNRVVFTGTTTSGMAASHVFKFQQENIQHPVASVFSSTEIRLVSVYSGTKALDTFSPYLVVTDFTINAGLSELFDGDVDIRAIITRNMQRIDQLLDLRWYVDNATGHLLPDTPSTRNVGSAAFPAGAVYTAQLVLGAGNGFLIGEAANILAQKNGVNGQILKVYRTEGGGAAEWLELNAAGDPMVLRTNQSGTGVARGVSIGPAGLAPITFQINGQNRWYIDTDFALKSGNLAAGDENIILSSAPSITFDIGDSAVPRQVMALVADSGGQGAIGIPNGGGLYLEATGTATAIQFRTNGTTERWRIDGNGHLIAAAADGGSLAFNPLSPIQLTANQNDYNPGHAGFWRLSSDASRNITGIVPVVNGRVLFLANIGGQNIVLTNEDVLSAAANRIITGTGASVTVAPDDTVILVYDSATQRWRVFNTH